MSATTTNSIASDKWRPPIFFITAFLFTNFLFFIDEGYYNFTWISDPANWIAFIIYVVPLLVVQYVLSLFMNRWLDGKTNTVISAVLGLTLATTGVILLLTS